MNYRSVDITDMQCWVFRMAQKKWNISATACAEIFKKYNILGFIEECYDSLHLNSYQAALDDVETILSRNGVVLG